MIGQTDSRSQYEDISNLYGCPDSYSNESCQKLIPINSAARTHLIFPASSQTRSCRGKKSTLGDSCRGVYEEAIRVEPLAEHF